MPQANKTTRLEARISPHALEVVKRAAEIQGRSVSDFVATAAHELARKTIEDAHIVNLSVDDQRRFAELLLDPPPFNDAMRRAEQAHKALIRTSTNAPVSD